MLKRGTPNNLERGSVDRMIARIAARANLDTIHGGARALVLARRAELMGLPSAGDMLGAVSEVYSMSSGRVPGSLAVVQCFECGQWYLGEERAAACCSEVECEC